MSCHCYPCVVSLKTRIVRILFSCMLPQTDNCPTTVYRHLQCMSLLIDVSGVLRGHYTIESFYDRKLWFLLWGLSLFLSLNSCFFIVYFRYILECDILWMYLFLPYCVRKWHNKTVQSINQSMLTQVGIAMWHQFSRLLIWVLLQKAFAHAG